MTDGYKGMPEYLRSDNESEFTAKKLRKWLSNVGVITAYIEAGSPWDSMPLRVEWVL